MRTAACYRNDYCGRSPVDGQMEGGEEERKEGDDQSIHTFIQEAFIKHLLHAKLCARC